MARKPLIELLNGVTRFGALTVLGEQDGRPTPGNGVPRLLICKCDCGTVKAFPVSNVKRGLSKSCGCQRADRVSRAKTRHGQGAAGRVTPEYRSWAHMIGRCERPTDRAFANYGGRGIKVCLRWRSNFEAFYADMGPRPEGHSIDRINVDGDYEPSNCRWADHGTQCRNKRANRMLAWQGRKVCLSDAARLAGLHRSTVERRLARGCSDKEALAPTTRS